MEAAWRATGHPVQVSVKDGDLDSCPRETADCGAWSVGLLKVVSKPERKRGDADPPRTASLIPLATDCETCDSLYVRRGDVRRREALEVTGIPPTAEHAEAVAMALPLARTALAQTAQQFVDQVSAE